MNARNKYEIAAGLNAALINRQREQIMELIAALKEAVFSLRRHYASQAALDAEEVLAKFGVKL